MVKKNCTLDSNLLAAMEEELKGVAPDDLLVSAQLSTPLQSKELADGHSKKKQRTMTPLEEHFLRMLIRRHGARQVGVDDDGAPIWCLNRGWSHARARDLIVLMVQAVRDNPKRFFRHFIAKELDARPTRQKDWSNQVEGPAQNETEVTDLLGLGLIESCPDDPQRHKLTNEGARVVREIRRRCMNRLKSHTSPSSHKELIKDIELCTAILDYYDVIIGKVKPRVSLN